MYFVWEVEIQAYEGKGGETPTCVATHIPVFINAPYSIVRPVLGLLYDRVNIKLHGID